MIKVTKDIAKKYSEIMAITAAYPIEFRRRERTLSLRESEQLEAMKKELGWEYERVHVWNAIVEGPKLHQTIANFKRKYKRKIKHDTRERLEEMQRRLQKTKDELRFIFEREFGTLPAELRD